MAKIGIIGSGFGGISAAIHCANDGHEVTVFEKNEQLGGRASVLQKNGFRRDMGPSWYLMPDLFDDFFRSFGLTIEDYLTLSPLDPSYKIYFNGSGKHIDVYKEVEKNRPEFERIEPGSTDKLHQYLETASYQYKIAMESFVPKNYDNIFDFFTRRMMTEGRKMNVLGNLHSYVQKYFKTPEMQKIMEYALVFLGTAPKDAPAMYNIMSHVDFNGGVRYPDGGINAIIQALVTIAKDKGVTFHTDSNVEKILVEKKQTQGLIINGKEENFDAVISNADYHFTETQLLDPQRQTYPQSFWDKKVIAPSGFIIYLGIRGKVQGLKHHTLLFADDRDHNFKEIFTDKVPPTDPSLYVCCPSKTDPTVAPEGCENLFILVPFPPGVEMTEDEIAAYRKLTIDTVQREIGDTFDDRIIEEEIFTVKDFHQRYNAFQGSALGLAHTLRQTAIFRPNTKSKKVKNLFYAGGYTNPGIGMPMCLISGNLAYQRIKKLFG